MSELRANARKYSGHRNRSAHKYGLLSLKSIKIGVAKASERNRVGFAFVLNTLKIGYFSRNSGNEPVKFHGNFAVEKTDNDMIIENIQSPADVKRLSVEEMKEMAAENRH